MFDWRVAAVIYAGFALGLLPLYAILPNADAAPVSESSEPARPEPPGCTGRPIRSAVLYATVIALGNGLHAGMSVHLISLLNELGLAAGAAVSVAVLRGVGQTAGRVADLAFGRNVDPVSLNAFAAALIVVSFALGFLAAGHYLGAATFVFLYGVATGLLTITRGTLPLVLFDPRRSGALVGILLVPSFLIPAASPNFFAYVLELFGPYATLGISLTVGVIIIAASLALPAQLDPISVHSCRSTNVSEGR